MLREYCDLCSNEVTGKQSAAIHAGSDCDKEGNGTLDLHWDIVCLSCFRKVKRFLASLKPASVKSKRKKTS